MKSIGDQIRKAREAKRWTQEQMADKLGITLRQYNKYEGGEFPKYKQEVVERIDQILGTTVRERIYEQNIPNKEASAAFGGDASAGVQDLLGVLVQLMKTQNHILEEQKEEIKDRVKRIDVNLTDALGRIDGIQFDIVSGRQVVLESLARLESKPEKNLLKQADNIKREIHSALQKRSSLAQRGR